MASVCSVESFPFDFFAPNGTRVPGELDPAGFCVFPDAACSPFDPVTTCCQAKSGVETTGDNYMFIAFAFIFAPTFFLRAGDDSDPEAKAARKARDERMVPSWVKKIPSRLVVKLFRYGLMAYVTMQVVVPIFMRNSIQDTLSVVNRNTVIAAEAFLVPYNQIFQFIEDIVMVRVNYALAWKKKELTNELVHIGLLGSFLTGVLAAVIATILGVIPSALSGLTNPGAEADAEAYPGCDLIAESTVSALPYWLVEAWAIPGNQMGMVLTGFMLGAMELPTVGWIGAISIAMIPIVWFTSVSGSSNPILVLAFAEFTSNWVLPVLAIAYLVSPLGAELREHTGVVLQISKFREYVALHFASTPRNDEAGTAKDAAISAGEPGTAARKSEDDVLLAEPQVDHASCAVENLGEEPGAVSEEPGAVSESPPPPETTQALLREGLKIMFMDVAVQVCISLSIYLALSSNAAEAYQLTALQSALPTYGIAYALGMGVVMKVVGPQLLAAGHVQVFARFVRITIVCSFLLIPLILGSALPFRPGLAFSYGGNACEYAKDSQCTPFFTSVFGPNAQGGTYTLPFTFDVFPLGACVEAVFFVLRSILLTLVDLDYMMTCTFVAIIVYIPAIAVAATVEPFGGKAISYFVAMYIPQVVLCVGFLFRIHVLISRMLSGASGSWSEKRSNRSSSFSFVPGMPQ